MTAGARARSGPGQHRSLDESFQRVNAMYFEGKLAKPADQFPIFPPQFDESSGEYNPKVETAEGAMALWRETERTLRQGLEHASPEARDRITKDLAVIEPATQRIGLRRDTSTVASDVFLRLGEAHAEAGVPIVRDAGAPKDGSADAK